MLLLVCYAILQIERSEENYDTLSYYDNAYNMMHIICIFLTKLEKKGENTIADVIKQLQDMPYPNFLFLKLLIKLLKNIFLNHGMQLLIMFSLILQILNFLFYSK